MSTGNDPKDDTAELTAFLHKMIEEESIVAARLSREFALAAGKCSPIALWTAATSIALHAIRQMEDKSTIGAEADFAKRIVADFKAHFIARLMTRGANEL